MIKKIKKNILIKYFFYFILFSLAGSLLEYFSKFIGGTGIAYDKGLYQLLGIKLFFIPFYGFGGLILIFFEKFMDRKKIKFGYRGILNAGVITIWELCGGLFTLLIFGQKFWDYSNHPLNFLGIISLQIFLIWIFIGYLFSFIYRYFINLLSFW